MDLALPHLDGVEHHYVTVGGIRLHYAEAGSGEPLVLQHGWPEHWWMWRYLIGPLSERYRVICPDLRGFGWSDAPATGYRKSELVEDLVGLLDALELESVRMIGHDWGAFVGFLTCLIHPQRVSRFMALSIPHLWPTPGDRDLRLLARAWYQLVLSAPVLGNLAVSRLGFPRAIMIKARAAGSFSEEELRTYQDAYSRPANARATVQLYRTFLVHELRPMLAGDYGAFRLTTPTRLLVGQRDPLRRGAEDDGYKAHADDMTVELIPGASHFLPEELPEVVLRRALDFL